MSKARQQANLSSDGNLFADISNDRVGIGSVVPTHKLHVNGTSKFDDDVKFEGSIAAKNILWDKSENALKFGDNVLSYYGSDNDLVMHHTGSTGYIKNTTGTLYIQDDSSVIIGKVTSSHTGMKFIGGGALELYHNNNLKLETTSTGAKVTGNLEVTGVLTYDDVTSIDSVGIVTAREGVVIPDTKELKFGSSAELKLSNNGNAGYIQHSGSGYLFIHGNDIALRSTSQKNYIVCDADNEVTLYFNNSPKFETTNTGATLDHTLTIGGDAGSPGRINFKEGGAVSEIRVTRNSDANSDLQFKTERGDGTVTRAKINYSGDFVVPSNKAGIGTDNPAYPLDIWDAGTQIRIQDSDPYTANAHTLFNQSGGQLTMINRNGAGYGTFIINQQNNSGQVERFRISNTGQIGVNNTSPDAWYSTYRSIQIYDGAVLYGSSDDSFVGLGANHFLNTSGDFKYSNTDFASRFYQVNGGFHFESVASGTAGNTFSFTEKFRIDSSGRIDILGDGGTAGFTLSNSYGQAGFFGGMYYNGSSWTRNATGTRKGAGMYINTGGHIAFLTSSETSGTSATVTERLRISSGGQVSISSDGTTDGLLTIKGDSDQVSTPSIRLLDGSDTREVSISNTSGDFVASVHGNDNAIHGHIKMFESGIFDINNGGSGGSNTNRLRIAANGNVSIGNNPTVASDTLLHVEKAGETNVKFEGNTTTLGARLSLQNNNTDAGAYNQIDFSDAGGQSTSSIKGFNTDQTNNHGDLGFFTRSAQGSPPAERLRIMSSGQVNIGTGELTQTDRMLNVYGGRARISGIPANNNSFEVYASSTTGQSHGILISAGTNSSDINANFRSVGGTSLLRIRGDGNIGINESSPNRRLYISDDSSTAYSSTNGANNAVLRLHNKNGTDNSGVNNHTGLEMYVANGAISVGMISMVRTGNNIGDLTYKTRTGANSYAEHLRIDSTGHVHVKGSDHEVRWYRDDGARYGAITYDGGNFNIKNPANDHTQITNSGGTPLIKFHNSGNILFGNHLNDRGAELQYEGSEHAGVGIHRNTNSHSSPALQFSKSRGTSAGSNTIVQNGDYLGMLSFKGTDGNDLANGAYITGIVDGTPGNNVMPARLGFWTSPVSSQTPVERLRIKSDGTITCSTDGWSDVVMRLVLNNPDSGASQMQFQHTGTGTSSTRGFRVGHNGSGGQLWNFESNYVRFATSNAEKIRITKDYLTQFGTINDPGWQTASGYYNIQLGHSAYFRSDTDGSSNFLSYGVNSYRDNSGWKFVENGRATQISHDCGNGAINFHVSNSGSADGAVTWNDTILKITHEKVVIGHSDAEWLEIPSDERCIVFDQGQKMITSNDGQGNFNMLCGVNHDNQHVNSDGSNSGVVRMTLNADGQDGDWAVGVGPLRSAGSTGNVTRGLRVEYSASGMNQLKFCQGSTSDPNGLATQYPIIHRGNAMDGSWGNNAGDGFKVLGDGGSIAITTNDGGGNANVCWNCANNTADTAGSAWRIRCDIDSTGSDMHFQTNSNVSNGGSVSTGSRMILASNGNLDIDGSYSSSDQRLKKNIQTITNATTIIKGLTGKTFEWKDELKLATGTKYGFIAQEVEAVVPDLIGRNTGKGFDKDGNILYDSYHNKDDIVEYSKSINDAGITPILVESLKEAIAKIETLEAKVAALEGS